MKAIVIFLLVVSLMRIGCRIAYLSDKEYPRVTTLSKVDDAWATIFSIAISVWCGYALLT